jgi:hypothetical protein
MPLIYIIKEMARDGQSVAGIARELAVDEKTVRKYLNLEDFSPSPPGGIVRPSKLDPHTTARTMARLGGCGIRDPRMGRLVQ